MGETNNNIRINSEDPLENILTAWLRVSAGVRNERLVHSMTFNEVFVCNILYSQTVLAEEMVTATDVCEQTGLLKSHANKVLVSMEKRGWILRERSKDDQRKVILRMTEQGEQQYLLEHGNVRKILEELANDLGDEKLTQASLILTEVAQVMRKISERI